MPKSTLEYIAALDVSHVSRSNARERNLFDNLNLAVKKRTERFLVHGKVLAVLRAFGRDEGRLRRESQLGHASTDGEDTAVN